MPRKLTHGTVTSTAARRLSVPRIPQKAAVPKKKLTPAQEAARIDVLMAKGKARIRGGKPRPGAVAAQVRKTPAQIRSERAAARRKKFEPGFLGPLGEALKPKKKK